VKWSPVLFAFLCIYNPIQAHSQADQPKPEVRVYETVGDRRLTAHIFREEGLARDKAAPVIILLHGGGWSRGTPEWVYSNARRYASYGAVAVAVEYRLCDQANITPLDTMADVSDLVLWLRDNERRGTPADNCSRKIPSDSPPLGG